MKRFICRSIAVLGLVLVVYRLLMLISKYYPLSNNIIGGVLLLAFIGSLVLDLLVRRSKHAKNVP